jgi:transcriptional regulator of acetoin/glycerol metabolism
LRASATDRSSQISSARHAVLAQRGDMANVAIEPWIERSWRRCLASGQRPDQRITFDAVSPQSARRAAEANRILVEAARPVLASLGRALANTRYFAILTNAEGAVVHVDGPIDRSDRRADLITRIGADLSEASVGTTAIGAALFEQQPVWLHRGEHFFNDTAVYSCAGAPLAGPQGRCVGMLDLTGIEVAERPELKHLAAQSARSIENALALAERHSLLLRLNWPGHGLGDDGDGLICVDGDGRVTAANSSARQMVSALAAGGAGGAAQVHCADLFALPFESLFDAAGRDAAPFEVPLWSGLHVQMTATLRGHAARGPVTEQAATRGAPQPLKELESALIRKAVQDARGNVMEAARALGISRATVYRKLGRRPA